MMCACVQQQPAPPPPPPLPAYRDDAVAPDPPLECLFVQLRLCVAAAAPGDGLARAVGQHPVNLPRVRSFLGGVGIYLFYLFILGQGGYHHPRHLVHITNIDTHIYNDRMNDVEWMIFFG